MLINLKNGDTVDAQLLDDGTEDTVVLLNGIEARYSAEFVAEYRETSGEFTRSGFARFVCEVVVPDCY